MKQTTFATAVLLLTFAVSGVEAASEATYPNRPLRFVVPFKNRLMTAFARSSASAGSPRNRSAAASRWPPRTYPRRGSAGSRRPGATVRSGHR